MERWIIVCADLHGALGLFPTEKAAILVAAHMTANDKAGCVYLPLRLQTQDTQEIEHATTTPHGQYL